MLLGQGGDKQEKYNLQLNLGFARTLHYNQPVNMTSCIEGCLVEEQKARVTPSININLYRNLNTKNSLKVGIGASSYKFWEMGQSNNGAGAFSAYESVNRWDFYSLAIGYRYFIHSERNIRFFLENEFVYEIPMQKYSLVKGGLAIQPKIGAIVNINNKWDMLVEGFYRSALTAYNDYSYGKSYKPYAYGVQLGVGLKI